MKLSDLNNKKALNSIKKYLDLSPTNKIAIGIIHKKTGYFTSEGISETSRFDIGSISKTFTAQIILDLVCDGKLKLDAAVDSYLSLPPGKYPTITQLLTHTAGYRHLTPVEITVPKLLNERYVVKNPYRGIKNNHVLAALSRRKNTKAKNKYGYSDFAYAILAMVAENITGIPFNQLLNQWIKEHCGLKHSEAYPTKPRVPVHLGRKTLNPWEWEKDNPYIAGGGVVSTIGDMVKYAKMQLESDYPHVREAQKIHSQSFSPESNIGTCLGWHTYKKSHQLWHVGGVGSFRSSIIINRHTGCAVVVLGNAKGKRSANIHYIAKLLYSEIKKKRINII